MLPNRRPLRCPLFETSTGREKAGKALAGELPIIGVGGIMSGHRPLRRRRRQPRAVLFSGFIYRGP